MASSTSARLVVMAGGGQAEDEIEGAVESIVVSGPTQVILGRSDGWIRRYDR